MDMRLEVGGQAYMTARHKGGDGPAAMRRRTGAGSGRDQMALQPPSTHTIWPVV